MGEEPPQVIRAYLNRCPLCGDGDPLIDDLCENCLEGRPFFLIDYTEPD